MFSSQALKNHLETSHTIETSQEVFIEFNMNQPDNIEKLGNYRYRPATGDPLYGSIKTTYDDDSGNIKYYTGATDSDIVVDFGYDDDVDNPQPMAFITPRKKMNLLYSLEDCIKPHRPRSGINKLLYLSTNGASYSSNQYVDSLTRFVSRRPRFYMSSKTDTFKYWTSYRTETDGEVNNEYGVSRKLLADNKNYISDAAPFVVYRDKVPCNKLVFKMQTGIGEVDLGPYRINDSINNPDPFYGSQNSRTPVRWTIQILDENDNWVNAIEFSDSSKREDDSPIVGPDGYVEIQFGLDVPNAYKNCFNLVGTVYSLESLPANQPIGYSYLYKQSATDIGLLYISDGQGWNSFVPTYSWTLADDQISASTKFISQLSNPQSYEVSGNTYYRDFQFIRGIRVVVQTMNVDNCTFDLIEMSPRLYARITDNVIDYQITKTLSDLGTTSLPVGGLLASIGSINIFDDDFSFSESNTFDENTGTGSIISKYVDNQIKFDFYESVKNINNYTYYIPLKTLYSQGFPQVSDSAATVSMQLRDFFFFLESQKSQPMLLTDVSLSYAITVLLDNVGFSNYTFKRTDTESELIIPYFFVGPDQSVAEVLQQLALSSQSAMFFDEYNNLVIMSKNYMLPSEDERATDTTLYGQEEVVGLDTMLPNIINLSSRDKKVFNGGQINYTTRYIQRSLGSIEQAPYIDEYKTYIYKPSLLWEVAGQQSRQTINELGAQSQGYSLAAAPLNISLSSTIPTVVSGQVIDNIIDLGEHVYWLGNYAGYFYANGEIIRYDAIEYSIQGIGNEWISNNHEYQDYFSQLKFNGKMYPTGRVRIYSLPKYEEDPVGSGIFVIKDGEVKEHGRGQFGTEIVTHSAGITDDSPWVQSDTIKGCFQSARQYLFTMSPSITYPSNMVVGEAGLVKNTTSGQFVANDYAAKSTRNGIIKNFMANRNYTENQIAEMKTAQSGTVQSSALVFNGPSIPDAISAADFVSYSYKELDKPYSHFGTRMRIIGKIESSTNKTQTPNGGYNIVSSNTIVPASSADEIKVIGGSGGIGFGINKNTNNGYFFEIVALSTSSMSSYTSNNSIANYNIVTSPIVTVVDGLVTITTSEQHTFNEGDTIIVSGLVDASRPTQTNTTINGEFTVSAIGNNRKTVQYQIPSPPAPYLTASITSATGDGTTITYICNNEFSAGQIVNITGGSNSSFNLSGAIVQSRTSTQFTVASTVAGSSTGGSAAFVALNTTATNGGQISKNLTDALSFSNIFFYKVVAGQNVSEIIKKSRTGTTATITTLNPHSFIAGDSITVDISGDSDLSGTFVVTAVSERTISYTTSTSGTIAETVLGTIGTVTGNEKIAIPKILWQGFSEIVVDDGKFTGQARMLGNETTTVYDLNVEYINAGSSRKFFLYLNGKQVATVEDSDPLPEYNNIALFVRGSSRCMFENVYAINNSYENVGANDSLQLPVSKVFGDEEISQNDAFNKYAISGFIQQTYLSGLGSEQGPRYNIYYDEFGTIMREAAYFNIRYDRAFPALYSKIANTLNGVKGYTYSGYIGGSYGAEFLLFNCTDKNINLDDTTGNYLRILGIAFTQSTTYSLTVDDYLKKFGNLSDPQIYDNYVASSTMGYKKIYDQIKNSRLKYGMNEFTIEAPYLQSTAAAESMMDWIINKTMYPRKTVGVNTFATPHIQLGDIVTVDYKNHDGQNVLSSTSERYVVYNIEMQKNNSGSSSTLYLAEI